MLIFHTLGFIKEALAQVVLRALGIGLLLTLLQIILLGHFQLKSAKVAETFPIGAIAAFSFVVALGEEANFRGFVFQTLERRWGTGIALIVSSVLFALAHLTNSGTAANIHMVSPVLVAFSCGLLFAAVFVLTRNLWASVALHFAWDFFHIVAFGFPPFEVSPLLHASLNPTWINPSSILLSLVAATLLLLLAVSKGRWNQSGTDVLASINSQSTEV